MLFFDISFGKSLELKSFFGERGKGSQLENKADKKEIKDNWNSGKICARLIATHKFPFLLWRKREPNKGFFPPPRQEYTVPKKDLSPPRVQEYTVPKKDFVHHHVYRSTLSPKNNLNLCMNTKPVTKGADSTVKVCFENEKISRYRFFL